MAQGTGTPFAALKILIGDGGTPTETFAPLCGVTQKSIDLSSDTVETEMPDCADESLPSYKNVGIKAISIKVSCSGKWTSQSHGTIFNWWRSATPKNIRVQYVNAASGDPEYMSGSAILANLKHDVQKGAFMDGSFDIMFAAQPTYQMKP